MRVAHLCPTLCDPMDCSPPGSSIHGILQARIMKWEFILSPGDLLDTRIKLGSPALQADSLPFEPQGRPKLIKDAFLQLGLKGENLSGRVNRNQIMLLKKKQVTRKHTKFDLNAGKKEKKISLDNLHEKATYECSSVTKSCPTLPDPMHCSTQGFPVLHCYSELAHTHVH